MAIITNKILSGNSQMTNIKKHKLYVKYCKITSQVIVTGTFKIVTRLDSVAILGADVDLLPFGQSWSLFVNLDVRGRLHCVMYSSKSDSENSLYLHCFGGFGLTVGSDATVACFVLIYGL